MTFKQNQPISILKNIFAGVSALLAFSLFLQGYLYGLVFFAVALKLALREGIEVDLSGIKYRKTYNILGFTDGKWKVLPSIEYVSVFKTKKKSRARVIAARAIMETEVYKVNLFHNTNQHIVAYVAEEKEKAYSVANQIAGILSIEIYDATN